MSYATRGCASEVEEFGERSDTFHNLTRMTALFNRKVRRRAASVWTRFLAIQTGTISVTVSVSCQNVAADCSRFPLMASSVRRSITFGLSLSRSQILNTLLVELPASSPFRCSCRPSCIAAAEGVLLSVRCQKLIIANTSALSL